MNAHAALKIIMMKDPAFFLLSILPLLISVQTHFIYAKRKVAVKHHPSGSFKSIFRSILRQSFGKNLFFGVFFIGDGYFSKQNGNRHLGEIICAQVFSAHFSTSRLVRKYKRCGKEINL